MIFLSNLIIFCPIFLFLHFLFIFLFKKWIYFYRIIVLFLITGVTLHDVSQIQTVSPHLIPFLEVDSLFLNWATLYAIITIFLINMLLIFGMLINFLNKKNETHDTIFDRIWSFFPYSELVYLDKNDPWDEVLKQSCYILFLWFLNIAFKKFYNCNYFKNILFNLIICIFRIILLFIFLVIVFPIPLFSICVQMEDWFIFLFNSRHALYNNIEHLNIYQHTYNTNNLSSENVETIESTNILKGTSHSTHVKSDKSASGNNDFRGGPGGGNNDPKGGSDLNYSNLDLNNKNRTNSHCIDCSNCCKLNCCQYCSNCTNFDKREINLSKKNDNSLIYGVFSSENLQNKDLLTWTKFDFYHKLMPFLANDVKVDNQTILNPYLNPYYRKSNLYFKNLDCAFDEYCSIFSFKLTEESFIKFKNGISTLVAQSSFNEDNVFFNNQIPDPDFKLLIIERESLKGYFKSQKIPFHNPNTSKRIMFESDNILNVIYNPNFNKSPFMCEMRFYFDLIIQNWFKLKCSNTSNGICFELQDTPTPNLDIAIRDVSEERVLKSIHIDFKVHNTWLFEIFDQCITDHDQNRVFMILEKVYIIDDLSVISFVPKKSVDFWTSRIPEI